MFNGEWGQGLVATQERVSSRCIELEFKDLEDL